MTIRVTSPSGIVAEFPEGTDANTIRRAMTEAQGQSQPPGPGQSFLEGLGQGATFGLSDEAEGAIRAGLGKLGGSPKSFSDLYGEGVQEPRKRQAAEAAAHPYAYHGGEFGGAAASALGLGALGIGIRGATGLGARTLQGAREGAIYGGLYGAGTAEGDERLSGAAQGAVTGALIGTAAPAAIDAVSGVLGAGTRAIRGMTQPREVANEKLAERIAQDHGASGSASDLRQAASDLRSRMSAAQGVSKPLILADFLGDNGRKLLRSAVNMPNDRRNALNKFLDQRQEGQWARVEGDFAAGLGNPQNYDVALGKLVADRKAAARPAFDNAYGAAWNVAGNDPLISLLQRPYMQRLLQKTQENVQGVTGEDVAQMRPWEALHRVKMQIDRELSGLKRGQPDAVANWNAADLAQLKSELVNRMKALNPEFKGAMEKYADDSSVINAAEDGYEEAFKMRPVEIRRKIDGLSRPEAEGYRMGAAQAFADKVRSPDRMRDRTKGEINSPEFDARIEALFPDAAARRAFKQSFQLERDMVKTRNAAQGNSTTAGQLIEGEEAGKATRAISAVANAAAGRFEPLLHGLSRLGNRFTGMTPATANATLETLMQPVGAQGTMALGQGLANALMRAGEVPANRAQVVNALAAAGPGLIGRQTMGPNTDYDPYRR